MLRGVTHACTQTKILGTTVKTPISVAPTAMQRLGHPDGEIGNAKASHDEAGAFILSSHSTTSMEDVAAACPDSHRFYQLYVYKDINITLDLIKRAQASGYKGIVFTVDTPFLGRRDADVRNKFVLPKSQTLANLSNNPAIAKILHNSSGGSGLQEYVASQTESNLTWNTIAWIRSVTELPIIVKGIMTAEDADLAVQAGAKAIYVSNHGGRQLDSVSASIDVLEEVATAVAGRAEVWFDGGVRTGTDVFKALALGATAVFLGRPVLYALGAGGEAGVRRMLQLINDELRLAMSLAGCASISDITRKHVDTRLSSKL
eukprot:TRINITY_DN7717_c0_g2_i2.p1 TRINITY_DN7717_c0_g2~~TRINITY_DN7717_c0_g2_i2.p1  ORF type:complete len:317 (+),score=55.85 TRINITY_DN7717_c0_g2_i2:73-1023(+)